MASPTCLFIIDVQKGFVNDATRHIPERVAAIQDRYDHVVATRFYNPQGSFYRTLIGWNRFPPGSDEVAFAFAPRDDALVVDKACYSSLSDEVVALLDRHRIGRVHLCGIATDGCVLKTAVDLFERGTVPVVLADYCASHGGIECHEAGLLLLRRFIGRGQVVEGLPAP